MDLQDILEQPAKTLTTAVIALVVGAAVIIVGLNGLHAVFG